MSSEASASERIDFRRYLGILLRRKWIVLFSFVGVLSSTLAGSLLTTPIYVASTTLQIEEEELKIGSELLRTVDVFGAKASLLDSEVEIIKSRTVAEEEVRKFNLDKEVHEISKGVSFAMTPVATANFAKPGTSTLVFKDSQGRYRVFNDAQELIGTGESDSPFHS